MTVYAITALKRENRDCAYLSSNYPKATSTVDQKQYVAMVTR